MFKDSALSQASDYFGEGEVEWLTGNNAGLFAKVKTHVNTSGAIFTLMQPMPATVQVGDTFTAIAGCRKRLLDDYVADQRVVAQELHIATRPHAFWT